MVGRTIDKLDVVWKTEESQTSNYSNGKIWIYKEKEDGNIVYTFWHEYGHFLDDTQYSDSGVTRNIYYNDERVVRDENGRPKRDENGKLIRETIRVKSNISAQGAAWCAEKLDGYYDAIGDDVREIIKGNKNVYVTTENGKAYVKSETTFDIVESDVQLMEMLYAKYKKFTGTDELDNFLYSKGKPKQPNWDDYYETYLTPKRHLARNKPRYKDSDIRYKEAMQQYWKDVDNFEKTHDMDALCKEIEKMQARVAQRESACDYATDTLDGLTNGAFNAHLLMGGHKAEYYRINSRGINEGVANVFMANVTGDKDVIDAMQAICPKTYKIYTEAWKQDGTN